MLCSSHSVSFGSCHSDDRQKLCRDVPDGMAQVFMCLQDKMGELQLTCRRAIFHQVRQEME